MKLEKLSTSHHGMEETVPLVPESGSSLKGAEEQPWPLASAQRKARPPVELEPNSIAHLMQRLELGLARRERRSEVTTVTEPVWQTAPAEPAAIDDRLRDAVAGLQKLAARSG
jgi:hypothetical protein